MAMIQYLNFSYKKTASFGDGFFMLELTNMLFYFAAAKRSAMTGQFTTFQNAAK